MLVYLDTPIGRLQIRSERGLLSAIVPVAEDIAGAEACRYSSLGTCVLQQAVLELQAWLTGERQTFDLPLLFQGSAFQNAVWKRLQMIPFGQVMSYGSLASAMNTHPLAIGQACARNPFLIVVPCHRVVRWDGVRQRLNNLSGHRCRPAYLGGYRAGLPAKQWLIGHESRAKWRLCQHI